MSDNIQHLDLESDEFYDAPKALRDYAKKLQAQNKTLNTELSTTRGQLASQALGGVLSDKGFKNPKRVEKDLLADGVNPLDKSAVDGWLAEFGDDYAQGAATSVAETPVVPDEERLAHEQLQVGSDFKQPADMSKFDAVMAEVGPNPTGEELQAAYRKHGL
jgi:hypothetical protein